MNRKVVMIRLRQLHYLLILASCCTLPDALGAESDPNLLVVAETDWGFDGRVTTKHFVPFSIRVTNLGQTPWEGFLSLRRMTRGTRQYGATIVEELLLQGEETRWIQLTPYVVDDLEDWELRWGEGDNHKVDLPPVIKGESPTVLIYDSEAATQSEAVFKRFPEERFPSSVTGTDSLRGIVLNSVPFWQGARARAFQDWLTLGGRVYILHNEAGEFPSFPVALSFLNNTSSEFSIGSGYVKKIPLKVGDFTLDEARTMIFNDDWDLADQKRNLQFQEQTVNSGSSSYPGYLGYNIHALSWSKHRAIFSKLTEFSQFRRRWWLIYSCVFAYLAIQYPFCFTLGTHHRDVHKFYSVFLAAAIIFALIFSLLGQVGGRAVNRIRSATIARSLGDGDFDITNWSVLANIYAGEQTLTYPGSGQTYSTTNESEHVLGSLNPGLSGGASFRMLPDSKQPLLLRSRVKTPMHDPVLVHNSSGELESRRFIVEIKDVFEEKPLFAAVVTQGLFYELDIKEDRMERSARTKSELLTTYLQEPLTYEFVTWGFQKTTKGTQNADEKLIELNQYRDLMRPLIGESFGLVDNIHLRKLKQDGQTVRLFVLTKTPRSLQFDTKSFPDQSGVTLFIYDLKQPL